MRGNYGGGVRVKGKRCGAEAVLRNEPKCLVGPVLPNELPGASEQGLVAIVDAVEVTDGEGATAEAAASFFEGAEDGRLAHERPFCETNPIGRPLIESETFRWGSRARRRRCGHWPAA